MAASFLFAWCSRTIDVENRAVPLPIMAAHPNEPSIFEIAVSTSFNASSKPPQEAGTSIRNTPIDFSASMRSSGIRRLSMEKEYAKS